MQSFSKEEEIEFGEYLSRDKDDMFFLDLSDASLVECVNKMCEIKSKSHPNIYRDYTLVLNKIRNIQDRYNCTIWPVTISSVFWNLFIPYLSKSGLKYSTINNIKTKIITALNWVSKYGVKLNPSYSEVKIPSYMPTKIALTPDEISHIYHFKLGMTKGYSWRSKKMIKYKKNKLKTLEKVRDMFVLGCNLGQRYSDLVRISPDNFKNGVFSMVQQKTGHRCWIDIDNMVIDKRVTYQILEKYGYYAPYQGDINNFNTYLHELLCYIGDTFKEEVHLENKINGTVVDEVKYKYQIISSHSARRTFATINTIRNIPRSKILRATGHTTEKAFTRYICYDEEIW